MGNVASWSGTKTLTCFEYYDQAYADYFNPGRGKFSGLVHINWASLKNTANGPTMDAPTTRGPFKDIGNEGYLGKKSGLKFKILSSQTSYSWFRPTESTIFQEK